MRARLLTSVFCIVGAAHGLATEPAKYRVTDPQLRVIPIDSSKKESFLSVRADSMGRLFVGGREALFVYEPQDGSPTGYGGRQELYRFPNHSWIYDIEIRGNDLYVLTLSALYRFRDGVTKRTGLTPQRLVWGPPDWHVHQAFHGLAWGPEGDLYISMGDLLVFYGDFNRPDHWGHWTMFSQPSGTKTPYTGVGGVFRCRPDGSRLQVVAGGTRNSCGLVFDSQWNLFCNDNDHEGLPTEYVPGRLLHVTPHVDFGWPRGWMPTKTPDRADLVQTMFDGMGRGVPVGQTYYDESFLPDRYRHRLLVARWGRRAITQYPLQQRGASFSTKESVFLEGVDTTRPVGVAVGRGGRLFATLAYMAHNEGSPVYPSDLVMITRRDDPAGFPFRAVDLTRADVSTLRRELARPDSWPARRAHQELLRRGDWRRPLDVDAILAGRVERDLALRQIWLDAATHAQGDRRADAANRLGRLLRLGHGEVAVTALRALGEFFVTAPPTRELVEDCLTHPDPRIQHAAVVAGFRLEPSPTRLHTPLGSKDTYLRQAAAMLVARTATVAALHRLCTSGHERTRMGGVLAVGFRLTLPHPTQPLDEQLPLQPWPTEKPYLIEYATESVDLRQHGRMGMFTNAEHWKARQKSADEERLFALLQTCLDDQAESVRLQAAHFLSLLKDPRAEVKVRQVRRRSERDRLVKAPIRSPAEVWVCGPFPDQDRGFDQIHPPQRGAINLAARYRLGDVRLSWQKLKRERMFNFQREFGDTAGHSVYAYFRLESPRSQQALLLPGSDDGLQIWNNGKRVFSHDVERGGLPLQDVVFIELQPGSNDILIRVRNIADQHNLYFHYRSLGGTVKATLPDRLDEKGLAARLRQAGKSTTGSLPPELLDVDWRQAMRDGDPEQGRKLFGKDGIGCAKCHSIDDGDAVQGGPSLTGAGGRFTLAYLVESILLPSRRISPVFQSTQIITDKGKVHSGLVLSQSAEKLVLLSREAKRIEIDTQHVEKRSAESVSPMPAGLVKKRHELADLLAYLMKKRGKAK